MSRIIGSDFKRSRRFGFSILENGKEFLKGKKRNYAPGQHGQKRKKLEDYGIHLQEKQKLRYVYGINEKQFKNTFKKVRKNQGDLGLNFYLALESRLDNLVYRAGFAETRKQARQMVNHGHVLLNGKKADIASMQIPLNATIEIKKNFQKNKLLLENLNSRKTAAWLERTAFQVKYFRFPKRDELNPNINEALIVEYYNR